MYQSPAYVLLFLNPPVRSPQHCRHILNPLIHPHHPPQFRFQQLADMAPRHLVNRMQCRQSLRLAQLRVGGIQQRVDIPDPKSERDAWIAATALEADLTLVSRNVSDFANMWVRMINPFKTEGD
jgi:hypothetical protein